MSRTTERLTPRHRSLLRKWAGEFLAESGPISPAEALSLLDDADELDAAGAAHVEQTEDPTSQKLDGKFHGIIVKNKDGSVVPQDQWVVFLAKDDAFPPTLIFYREQCRLAGAAPEQLRAVDEMIGRVAAWRQSNPGLCKTPGVAAGEIVT